MIVLGGMTLLFLLIVFIATMRGTSNANQIAESKQQLNVLNSQVLMKRNELNELDQQIHHKTIDRKSNLPMMVNEVLDIYEESNIKVPLDIIEELQYMKFSNDKEVYDYIENQRTYWQLENRKKTYRKVK